MGSYFRTDPRKDTEERIKDTMLEVGHSISMTTITTMTSFLLGCMSTIPAIRWLCIYAVPTMAIVFIYQLTFFVGTLVLDERRVKANRKDLCICYVVNDNESSSDRRKKELVGESVVRKDTDADHGIQRVESTTSRQDDLDKHEDGNSTGCELPEGANRLPIEDDRKSLGCESDNTNAKGLGSADRFMGWYSTQLMRPSVKAIVLAVFTAYFAFAIYCTTNLSQRFRSQDFVPEDSYVGNFLEALDSYSDHVIGINVYFRGVNQSDPAVQQEMRQYMDDLIKMPAVNGTDPAFCWVMDIEKLKSRPAFELIKDMSFSDQVSIVLNHPIGKEAYGDDIVLDENGTIVASRCWLNPKYLDLNVVKEQINLLADQRAVSLAQPVNNGSLDDMKFFTFDKMFFLWVRAKAVFA
jgi:predicted RND superfamily exporter protein